MDKKILIPIGIVGFGMLVFLLIRRKTASSTEEEQTIPIFMQSPNFGLGSLPMLASIGAYDSITPETSTTTVPSTQTTQTTQTTETSQTSASSATEQEIIGLKERLLEILDSLPIHRGVFKENSEEERKYRSLSDRRRGLLEKVRKATTLDELKRLENEVKEFYREYTEFIRKFEKPSFDNKVKVEIPSDLKIETPSSSRIEEIKEITRTRVIPNIAEATKISAIGGIVSGIKPETKTQITSVQLPAKFDESPEIVKQAKTNAIKKQEEKTSIKNVSEIVKTSSLAGIIPKIQKDSNKAQINAEAVKQGTIAGAILSQKEASKPTQQTQIPQERQAVVKYPNIQAQQTQQTQIPQERQAVDRYQNKSELEKKVFETQAKQEIPIPQERQAVVRHYANR